MYFLLEKQEEVAYIRLCEEKEVNIHFFSPEEIHGCMVKKQGNTLHVMIQVPRQEGNRIGKKQTVPLLGQGYAFARFSFVIKEDGIWFADYDGYLMPLMERLMLENGEKAPEMMLYHLFQMLVENDVQVLDLVYKQLTLLEEEIPKDGARFFLQKMYTMKHSISLLPSADGIGR